MMKRVLIAILLGGLASFSASVSGQSATVTQDVMDESVVRSSGGEIRIVLSGTVFRALNNTRRQNIIDGLEGSTAFELVKASIPLGNVQASFNVATVTLPAVPGYYIDANDQITVTVDESVILASSSITASNQVLISNLPTSIAYSGSILSGNSEQDVRSGGRILSLTANYNLWRSNLGSTDVASVRAIFSAGTFRDEVVSLLSSSDVVVNQNVLTITFPPAANYYLGNNEAVGLNIASSLLQNPESLSSHTSSFTISNEDPVVFMQNIAFQESDVRSGPQSFSVTVTGDRLIPTLNVAGLRNDFNGGAGWETYLESSLTFERNNDHQFTVTVPANAGFNIDVEEEVALWMGSENLESTMSGSFPDAVNRITLIPIFPSMSISSTPSPLTGGNLDGAVITVTLTETRLNDLSVAASSISADPAVPGLTFGTPVNETFTSFEVPLSFSGAVSDGQTLSILLAADETRYGAELKSNALPLSALYVPIVSSVSIPNQPMGIGDVITATIFFESNNEPGPFTYEGGTIESEVLNAGSIRKINSSTYTGTFTIRDGTTNRAAGQSIRVRDLRFANGGNAGPSRDYDIVQNNDPIDTEVPSISHIAYVDGQEHRIGSEVRGTVTADGNNYEFDNARSFINGISFATPQITVQNNNDNTYLVSYVPIEGNEDVPVGDDIVVALVMTDIAGNSNPTPVSTLRNGHSPVIDANSPFLDSAKVMNPGVKVVGDEVEIHLFASERLNLPNPPTSGTHVNFVPISSSRVDLSRISNRVYRLLYTVGSGDNGVAPGQLSYNLEMEDMLGNTASSNIPLIDNNVTIGSALPTATIVGSGGVCEGDSLFANLYMTGTPPWDLVVSNSSGEYAKLEEITSPHSIWLKPEQEESYFVSSIVDGNGVEGIPYGEAVVTINEPTPVQIILDRTTYLASEPGVELHADFEPGLFSGRGVSIGYFYPSVATPVGSPHTITYEYKNLDGCTSFDSIDVEVLEGSGSVVLLSEEDTISVLCDDQDTYTLLGRNKEGLPGYFELRLTNSNTVVPGHIIDSDSSDNEAVFDPAGLSGGYDILYTYVIDEVVLSASWFVRIDQIGTLQIVDLPEQMCKNDSPVQLRGNMDELDPLATWSFSGPGVSGNMDKGYYFDPRSDDVETGANTLLYEYTTEGGCTASAGKKINVGYVPDVRFDISSSCISSDGGEIQFTNRTTGKFSVAKWNWVFGDIGSGVNNFSSLENPAHLYEDPGQRRINLTATTHEGCVTWHEMDTLLADEPNVDFTWLSDCFTRGADVVFINRTESSFSSIDTMVWSFMTEQGSILGILGTSAGEDTVRFPFNSTGTYEVALNVENSGGCNASLSRDIIFKNTIKVSRWGLKETFNGSNNSWAIQSEDGEESWVWGSPDFNGFDQDTTDRAWYTDLPYGVVGYNENSWIQSPCYDFTELKRPVIQVDIMKSFVPNLNGAVLQYQDVVEKGWKTVGLLEDGIEWYNSNTIFNKPGGSAFGWSLNEFIPDEDWVNATHDLDMLAGNQQVKFRFIIGTNGGQGLGNQGFAFDNVFLGERNRKSVLEHFTNSADTASARADTEVDAYYKANYWDVIDLHYHMEYPGYDPMNENNGDPAAIRSGAIGVRLDQVPYAILNGGATEMHRYDFSTVGESPDSISLRMSNLQIPPFGLDMAVDWHEESLDVNVTATCATDYFENNLQLYVVVIESEVTAYTGQNGDTLFRNVVLDMLPTPQGKLLGRDWQRGDEVSQSFTWEFAPYVEDVEDLGVISFIEDRETREILQATSEHLDSQVGIRRKESAINSELLIYPNPARELVYVNLGKEPGGMGSLELTDLSGRVLQKLQVLPGYSIYQLRLENMPAGFYMVRWMENGMEKGYAKLIRSR